MESVLYAFEGGSDGGYPEAGLINVNGTLYGTTYEGGGSDLGTVFALTTSGTKTVLHSFAGGTDGARPVGDLIAVNGTLYGMTYLGGRGPCYYSQGCGTVFEITTSGSESVIYKFQGGSDGSNPKAGLTNVNGTLYGTTREGGAKNFGTVFTITTSGTESVLYSFKGGTSDGSYPEATLTSDSAGTTLFGTTNSGGAYTYGGTVFSITTSGTETLLHSFGGSVDGAYPTAGLTNVSGTYYGVTPAGGANNDGTVFSVTASGTEAVLHSFSGSDGESPDAGLTNVKGTLYGTTSLGGYIVYGGDCGIGCGTVFSITTSGTETVLYVFLGGSNGSTPLGDLISANGTLYGTTANGGLCCNYGTVFSLAPPPETVLHSFGGSPDGQNPYAGIVLAPNGALYGTTPAGGAYSAGTVYSIKSGTESVLQSFYTGSDGQNPYAGLIDGTKRLYGTTAAGGVYNAGTAFSMTASGAETVLHSFGGGSGDGTTPLAPLLDATSTVYGTTESGGAYGRGTVFAIAKSSGRETLLHSFGGGSGDGASPEYAKLINLNGTMYGTTRSGGAHNQGTVYSITASGVETVLHSFGGGSGGGAGPYAGLIAVNGTLCGTTLNGGANGQGTVYSITIAPSGAETVLHSFGGSSGDGAGPYAGLLAVNGTLYGTTASGGANGQGTVYSIMPTSSGTYAVLWSFGSQYDGATPRASLIRINGFLYGTTTQGGTYGDGTVFKLLL
jgi:uncharacterized repeat protein (TIGR03803 family)